MSRTSAKPRNKSTTQRRELISELQYLGQMASTETALFHHIAADKSGLTITDSKTVSTLMQEGPMTAGDIAKRLSLTTGAVTSVIDRLENAGFAHRKADAKDRRKVIVELDGKKLKRASKLYDSIGKAFDKLLQNYSTDELKFLVDYYKVTIEHTKTEIAKLSKLDSI